MAKQQNKQNKQNVQVADQAYTSETNNTANSVIEEQISDTVAEGTIDAKLGKESQEKA
ncbi:YozQ family protein [Bacillus paramycoides]|uniref:YozQ family protein n=1 Tax=Bacillus paramycoides TaxID=2026194 RepID=UPI003CFF54A3